MERITVYLAAVCVLQVALAVELRVEYPLVDAVSADGNYSVVTLSCLRNTLGEPLQRDQFPATFLRNGSVITPNSSLVTVTSGGSENISFVFTQEQEGEFSCRTALGEVSNTVGLAGSYSINSICKTK